MNNAIGIASYKKPYSCEVTRNWETNETKIITFFPGDIDEALFDDAIFSIRRLLRIDGGKKAPAPVVPKRVIFNDPATIVFWSDGTKTVTKCKGCDEYEPLFGVLACAMRKVGRNKVSVDAWEGVLAFLADSLADADECRVLADALNATADALDCGDTMDAIVCHEMRGGEGEGEELPQEPLPLVDDGSPDERHERTRSLLRELLDRGEL